jgi:DNA polymerase-4
MDRRIVCFRIPSFEIGLARLDDPTLRGRPLATASMDHARAILREASREAERDGVHPGMTVGHARWLCPALRLLPSSASRIRRGEVALTAVIERFAPVWEPVRPGHVFLDLTGTHRLFGSAADVALRIERELVRAHSLAAAVGIGTNKLVTHVASSLLEPEQFWDVAPGKESAFMAPLPPALLPDLRSHSGRRTLAILEDLHLTTLGKVAAVPSECLERLLGPLGTRLHQHARGIDSGPVLAAAHQPTVRAAITLACETDDARHLMGLLSRAVGRVCRDLRRRNRGGRAIRVTVIYSDHVEMSRSATLSRETCWEFDVRAVAGRLLAQCVSRRVRVRRLIVEVGRLAACAEQMALFPAARAEAPRRLSSALDRIRERFGEDAVWWGAAATPADSEHAPVR